MLQGSVLFAASPSKQRRYDQGPLKYSEFRQNSKDSMPGHAQTIAQVMYQYKTFIKQTARDRFEVRLTSLETYSVFLRSQSWWNHPESEELLDHEQGHFDIAEISARRLELSFRETLKNGKPIRGTGKSKRAANYDLEQKLQKVFDLANEQSLDENRQYDQQTRHGARHGQQSEFRRIQKLTLEKLAKELGGSQKAKARKSKSGTKQ